MTISSSRVSDNSCAISLLFSGRDSFRIAAAGLCPDANSGRIGAFKGRRCCGLPIQSVCCRRVYRGERLSGGRLD